MLALVLVAGALATGAVPAPAGAQARLVNALVRTFPARPAPGDDVTVVVGVTGCPTGSVTVELYLETSDGATRSAVLMTRAAAVTNLLFRTRAVLRLPAAVQGWYGARVLCGTFRPPKTAMANTLFAVGADATPTAELGGATVATGGSLSLSGTGCPGPTVEYSIASAARWAGAFDPAGTIGVGPDGTWSGDVTFGADVEPGSTVVRTRCVTANQYGETIYVYSRGPSEVTVTK